MNYLNRENASFSSSIWDKIDQAAVNAAREILTGRRFLEVEGPYGVGLTSIEVGEEGFCRQPEPEEAGAVLSKAVALPMLRKRFDLSVRRLEGYEAAGQPLNLRAAEDAGEAVARREEEFIYYGQPDFGLEGLLTAKNRNQVECEDWSKIEQALEDVLRSVNHLDDNGFYGPYALVLSPQWYNLLFRRYEGTDMLQLEHLKRLCELGVFKAAIEGAVLVDGRVGRIIVGQDLMTGYSANDGIHHQMFASESLALILEEPGAICTLNKKA